MAEQLYRYCWANNATRAMWKDRIVRVIASRGALNSCVIEDIETGERMVTSRNALRKVREMPDD